VRNYYNRQEGERAMLTARLAEREEPGHKRRKLQKDPAIDDNRG